MEVVLHKPDTIYSRRHVPSWLLLSAAAGLVNGFAFLMCEHFVTHVTGTVTRLGLEAHAFRKRAPPPFLIAPRRCRVC